MKYITSKEAPAAVGPYSHATNIGNVVYCSGQIGLDPETGALIEGGVLREMQQICFNLTKVLEAAGCSTETIAKVDIFLTDIEDFAQVNTVYESWLGTARPARATVEVSKLPKGAHVELSCIAYQNT